METRAASAVVILVAATVASADDHPGRQQAGPRPVAPVATDLEPPPSRIGLFAVSGAPAVTVPVPASPPPACRAARLYVEPSLAFGGDSFALRHGLGAELRDCSGGSGIEGHLGGRLDIGDAGGFAGIEAALSVPLRDELRIALVASQTKGSGTQQMAGIRIGSRAAWLGVDLVHTGYDRMQDPTSTGAMISLGFGGRAGKQIAKAEVYALYVVTQLMSAVPAKE